MAKDDGFVTLRSRMQHGLATSIGKYDEARKDKSSKKTSKRTMELFTNQLLRKKLFDFSAIREQAFRYALD